MDGHFVFILLIILALVFIFDGLFYQNRRVLGLLELEIWSDELPVEDFI